MISHGEGWINSTKVKFVMKKLGWERRREIVRNCWRNFFTLPIFFWLYGCLGALRFEIYSKHYKTNGKQFDKKYLSSSVARNSTPLNRNCDWDFRHCSRKKSRTGIAMFKDGNPVAQVQFLDLNRREPHYHFIKGRMRMSSSAEFSLTVGQNRLEYPWRKVHPAESSILKYDGTRGQGCSKETCSSKRNMTLAIQRDARPIYVKKTPKSVPSVPFSLHCMIFKEDNVL